MNTQITDVTNCIQLINLLVLLLVVDKGVGLPLYR